jgi:hypothetical protein
MTKVGKIGRPCWSDWLAHVLTNVNSENLRMANFVPPLCRAHQGDFIFYILFA